MWRKGLTEIIAGSPRKTPFGDHEAFFSSVFAAAAAAAAVAVAVAAAAVAAAVATTAAKQNNNLSRCTSNTWSRIMIRKHRCSTETPDGSRPLGNLYHETKNEWIHT